MSLACRKPVFYLHVRSCSRLLDWPSELLQPGALLPACQHLHTRYARGPCPAAVHTFVLCCCCVGTVVYLDAWFVMHLLCLTSRASSSSCLTHSRDGHQSHPAQTNQPQRHSAIQVLHAVRTHRHLCKRGIVMCFVFLCSCLFSVSWLFSSGFPLDSSTVCRPEPLVTFAMCNGSRSGARVLVTYTRNPTIPDMIIPER